MKKLILAAVTLALLTSGCKVFKSSKKSEAAAPKTETTAEPKVFSVPAPKSTVRENPVSDTMYEPADKAAEGKPVSIRSERVTFTAEDQAAYGNKSYYVIVGSFSSNDNANRFKQELIQQSFKPIVMHSETGYYRVCVDAFNDEAAARSRVQKIRAEFPKYADSWLLIKK
jgi:cell division protein FtsN